LQVEVHKFAQAVPVQPARHWCDNATSARNQPYHRSCRKEAQCFPSPPSLYQA
jgi:hypothetical protein